jgi:hypothetical protein
MRLLEDRRMGGELSYVLTSGDRLMRVPENIRKSVGFVGHKGPDGRETFHGTFYLVYVVMGENYTCKYGVTAAHVINGMRSVGMEPMLRINRVDGTTRWIRTRYENWSVADDPTHDTAIVRLPIGQEWDYLAINTEMALTDSRIAEFEIGPGHEVFIPGLFLMFDDPARVYGVDRNVPIVRAGHVSAMPGESVPTDLGKMDAYLIEARSIGGLSGSPVFLHMGSVWVKDGKVLTARRDDGSPADSGIFYLLGHVHGHFPVLAATPRATAAGMSQRDVNMGISIVVPVSRLEMLLDRPDVSSARDVEFAAWQARVATADLGTTAQ